LDLLIEAPSETRLSTLVSLARSGLDYAFFQILSDRVNAATDHQKQKLIDLREKLLKLTGEIDKVTQRQQAESRQLLEKIASAPDVRQAAMENLEAFNDFFMETLQSEMQSARQKADLDRIGKLQKIVSVVEEASAPPPELELIDKLVGSPDDESRRKLLEENAAMVTPEFMDLLNNLMMQSETQEQLKDARVQIQQAYSSALRFSMQANLKK
jgi:hypothetical protein